MVDDAEEAGKQATIPTPSVPVAVTWMDWLPVGTTPPADDELITRGELLARLKEVGVELTPRTLQVWEQLGIMPRPTRRWHNGANRSFYAAWVVHIGRWADLLKTYGDSPFALGERLRTMVATAIQHSAVWDEAIADGRLAPALAGLAGRFETKVGERPGLIKIQMTRDDGELLEVYTFAVPSHGDGVNADS